LIVPRGKWPGVANVALQDFMKQRLRPEALAVFTEG